MNRNLIHEIVATDEFSSSIELEVRNFLKSLNLDYDEVKCHYIPRDEAIEVMVSIDGNCHYMHCWDEDNKFIFEVDGNLISENLRKTIDSIIDEDEIAIVREAILMLDVER